MSKLRLDYFLSLGLKLVDGDTYTLGLDKLEVGNDISANFANDKDDGSDSERFITSFAPRKNTGEQPCGDDAPVIVSWFVDGEDDQSNSDAHDFRWSFVGHDNCDIESWKPDLDALIKMQDEFDNKQQVVADSQEIAKAMSDGVDLGITEEDMEYAQETFESAMSNAKPFLQTGENFEHTKNLNFILERMVNIHGENSNVDYIHRLKNAISFVERAESVAVDTAKQKPRVKVEYVRVNFNHAWEAVKAFEEGAMFFAKKNSEEFNHVSINDATRYINRLYRKVETEISWQDELEEFVGSNSSLRECLESAADSPDDFIQMCHLVSSLNK